MRFFLNHRRFLRTDRPERVGKSPHELLTGRAHPHWLELLGHERFDRNGSAQAPACCPLSPPIPQGRDTRSIQSVTLKRPVLNQAILCHGPAVPASRFAQQTPWADAPKQ